MIQNHPTIFVGVCCQSCRWRDAPEPDTCQEINPFTGERPEDTDVCCFWQDPFYQRFGDIFRDIQNDWDIVRKGL